MGIFYVPVPHSINRNQENENKLYEEFRKLREKLSWGDLPLSVSTCKKVKEKIKTATNISAQKLKVGTESAKPSIRQRLQMMQSTKGSSSGTGDGQT